MSRESFDIEAALEKCHKGTAWQRDLIHAQLIAAALTAAGSIRWQYPELSDELRELCARATTDVDVVTLPIEERSAMQEEIERLREALKPFATIDLLECRLPPEFAMHVLRARGAAGYARGLAENKRLRAELETERIRLAACGVVALSNTPESAEKARKMLPEYRSGSCDDVARMVDQQMDLRAEVARLTACLRYEQHRAERIGTHGPGCELWGPAHYECAVRALKELESRADHAHVLTDDMLRYAMVALGTNSPADADLYRAFWFHAVTMQESQRKLAEQEGE